MFATVLIANRGEIALRIARTCREMGVRVVVAHSTADRDSGAVRFADRAVQVGPTPPRRSYLNVPALLEAAFQSGADAIHPGYGFLSEDADFAEICADHGLTFIGPSPAVMKLLSDKAEAKQVMRAAGLPVLPGSDEAVLSLSEADGVAAATGYPVMLKAAAGGGGRGMAIVRRRADLAGAYQRCRASAQAVFGDGRIYVERYLESARHVEIQVLADAHGHAISLGERDCSVQRRHQKLVEETPAPGLPAELTARMGAAAVAGALSTGYQGLGTFEFLVDDGGAFHFMEINCRIQVEHPVTEMVTGLDLVREQLLVAAGAPLRDDHVPPRGAAVECRVNAEDPDRDFRPTAGLLERFDQPGGPFTRVDTHCHQGWAVGPDYDSLLAKLITWAPDRDQALERMDRALSEFHVTGRGVLTTIGFLRQVLAHPTFRRGTHTTTFVERMLAERT